MVAIIIVVVGGAGGGEKYCKLFLFFSSPLIDETQQLDAIRCRGNDRTRKMELLYVRGRQMLCETGGRGKGRQGRRASEPECEEDNQWRLFCPQEKHKQRTSVKLGSRRTA